MTDKKKPEVWLRGPLDGVLPILQPVAHALLQAREEINELMTAFLKNYCGRSLQAWHRRDFIYSI
jgi:hypothetical protein